MDEEDGRLGPRARQTGRVDVLRDALMMSLCHSSKHLHSAHKNPEAIFGPEICALKDPTQSEVIP